MADEPLTIDDDDRYARLRLISWWKQERLAAARVLVVGAGALGNEVLKNLVLLGVGRIFVIDFDVVEHSNLSRSVLFRGADRGRPKALVAAERMREINPDCQIIARFGNIITDVGLGLFHDVDLAIGCLDNREARLWVNRQCWKTGTPWIDGGIQEISGVVKVFRPPTSACYECAMTENDYRLINLRYSCPLLSHDDLLAGRVPTAPTIASFIAALQVQEALKLLHDLPVVAGRAHVFNGESNQLYATDLPFREDCLSHESWPAPIELTLAASTCTAAELFAATREHFNGDDQRILSLERDLVVSLECPTCGQLRRIMRPHMLVRNQEAVCPCGQLSSPVFASRVSERDELAGETLAALGIPPYDMLRVTCGEEQRAFLLAGDRSAWEQ